jgi:hypothetical protein
LCCDKGHQEGQETQPTTGPLDGDNPGGWADLTFCAKGGTMLKKLSGKQEPQKDPKDEATRKFYELVVLYTMSFHRNEGKPDWFYDRIEQLERDLGEETAKAALDYASHNESFYYRLMY